MRTLLPLLAVSVLAGPANAQDATLAPKIAEAARIYLEQEKGTGLAIGIVRDGRTSFHNFGSSARGAIPVTEQTEFEIGSVAKTMSGLMLARAVLAGKADLNDDVRKYLDGAFPKLEFAGEPVRLLHLANMTSALPDNLPELFALEPDPGRFKRAAALAAYGKAHFMADLRKIAPREKPGASVGHSNAAAQLLNYVLERIYGMPYETILQREIGKPLGFTAGQDATGYDGNQRQAAVLPRQHFGDRYSMADMMKYAALQLDERDPAVALSHKGSWFTLDRKTYIGLTWIVSEVPEGGRLIRYSGGTWGFSSAMMLFPERRLAIVLMANNASDTAQDRLTAIATLLAGAVQP
jgi:D-alanyl-D-alanine-carboxypeptidase/D-alanyl-D-alanine-endopeptidase